MGNNFSTIGDLFFPDNPDRRRRAEELKNQINAFGQEFNQLKARREQKLNSIRTKLDNLMRSKGFATTQQLENRVKSILTGPELSKYNDFKKKLDLNEKVQGIIWDAIGIVGVASGIILGVSVLGGVITGGAALAALGAVGEILAVVAAIIIIFGVIEGAVERSKLRDAINNLWPQRAKIKQALEQMRVVVNWVDALDVWLNNPVTSNPATLNVLLNGSFEPEYESWTLDHVYDVLLAMDRRNGSWTNEDPAKNSLRAAKLALATAVPTEAAELGATAAVDEDPADDLVITETGLSPETGRFVYKQLLSRESCLVEIDGQPWKLIATSWDEKNTQLDTTLFDIEPVEVQSSKLLGNIGSAVKTVVSAASGSGFAPRRNCTITVVDYSTS